VTILDGASLYECESSGGSERVPSSRPTTNTSARSAARGMSRSGPTPTTVRRHVSRPQRTSAGRRRGEGANPGHARLELDPTLAPSPVPPSTSTVPPAQRLGEKGFVGKKEGSACSGRDNRGGVCVERARRVRERTCSHGSDGRSLLREPDAAEQVFGAGVLIPQAHLLQDRSEWRPRSELADLPEIVADQLAPTTGSSPALYRREEELPTPLRM
jgi:hypothetical protein